MTKKFHNFGGKGSKLSTIKVCYMAHLCILNLYRQLVEVWAFSFITNESLVGVMNIN